MNVPIRTEIPDAIRKRIGSYTNRFTSGGANITVGTPVDGLSWETVVAAGLPWLFSQLSGNGQTDTSWGLEDTDMDGIPDILEGGADCDDIYKAYEQAKAAKRAALECLNGGPVRRRRRRKMLTQGDKVDLTYLKSLGFTKAELAAVVAARVGG